MKTRIVLSIFLALISCAVFGESFFKSLYTSNSPGVSRSYNTHLQALYHQEDDVREDMYEKLEEAVDENGQKRGDYAYPYYVLTSFILAEHAPSNFNSSGSYRDDVGELQQEALEFLIKRVDDSDLSISEREFLIERLGIIAISDTLVDFDMNTEAYKALVEFVEDDSQLMAHAALIGIANVVTKKGDKWEDMAEQSADLLKDALEADSPEIRRVALFECIDVMKRAVHATDGVVDIWEAVIARVEDVESQNLKEILKRELELVLDLKSDSEFSDEVDDLKEEWLDIVVEKKTEDDPLDELLRSLKEEDDILDLEVLLNSLKKIALQDRTNFNSVFWQLQLIPFQSDINVEKLRRVNQYILDMVHEFGDPLYYYQAAMLQIGEVYHYQSDYRAVIPLSYLVRHLGSTDFEGLVLPVLQVIERSSQSRLPVWIQRKLVTLIFLQAGDSPNDKIAVTASEYLWQIASQSDLLVLRLEAMNKLKILAQRSGNKASMDVARQKLQ